MKKTLINYLTFCLLGLGATNLSAQYCTTSVGATNSADSNVESVALSGDASSAINYTGCAGTVGPTGLADSTGNITVNVTAGNAYTANIQFGTCGGNYAGAGEAWIDWNQNDVFDPAESIGTWSGTPPVALSVFNFTVPASAFNGTTRMRVIQQEGGGNPLNPCASFTYGSMTDFSVVVSGGVTITCPNPSTLTATNITPTSADLGWTENGSATNWIIEYGAQGFAQGSGTSIAANANPFNVSSLTQNTNYDYYVRAFCGAGDSSLWVGPFNFQTPCSALSAPFLEAFATASLPACWTQGGATSWEYGSISGTTPAGFADYGANGVPDHSIGASGTFIGMDGSDNTNGEVSTLLSPLVDISGLTNPQLSYWVFSNNTTNAALNKLIVEFYDGASWTVVDSIQANLGTTWVEFTTDLTTFTITGNTQIRFTLTGDNSAGGNTYNNDILIDDVALRQAPTCLTPTTQTAANITTTTADLGWTENGSATNWVIEYGTQGFAPGAGTTIAANANPFNTTSLTPSTNYDYYVRAVCGAGDSSMWVGPFNFQTACGAITAPWTETFTSTSLPTCWTDNGNDPYIFSTGADYGASSAGDYTSGGGTNYAWVDGSGGGNTFDTLTSPQIDISGLTTPHLCFALFSNNTNDAGNNTITVQFFDGAAWNNVATFQQNFGPGWAPFSYDLSGYTITGNTNVRFITNTNSTGDAYFNDILIDDVSMNNGGCPQFCVAPSTLTSANLTANSVDFGWTENGAATSWQVSYGAVGAPAGSGMSAVTSTNPHNITSLMPNTGYDLYVRAICGPGDTSLWTGPLNITTLALCPIPSNQTVANLTATSVDLGWTENGSATSWLVEYGTQGFAQGTGTPVVTGTNPHNVTSLNSDTDYSFYVRAICGVGDTSPAVGPFNFHTPCSVVSGDVSGDAISIGTLPYNTTGNTDSCYMDTRNNTSADVWYQYIVEQCTDSLTISLCGSAFDTYLRVFASDANTQIFFNDDNFAACGAGNNSHLAIDVTNSSAINPGDTVYILVEGYNANQGIYNLDVSRTIQCPPVADLVITEIMYNPPEAFTDTLEFVEIYNNGPTAANLNNYTVSGVTYTFPNINLAAGAYYVIAGDSAAFNNVYGVTADGIFTGGLNNNGEAIIIRTPTGAIADSVRYDDGGVWTNTPDGNGPSLILCDTATDNADGNNWSASATSTGVTVNGNIVMASPGVGNTCPPPAMNVAVASFLNLDTTYCNAGTISGSVIITNMTANDATNVPYAITANGLPLALDTIPLLAGNASDTITVGPFPAATGIANILATTALTGDNDTSNDSLWMMVFVSNTSAATSMTAAISCNGDSTGEVTAVGTNGLGNYNYAWGANTGNAATAVVPNLPAGTYMVVITDSIGCSDSSTVTLTEPTAIALTDSVTNVLCKGDSSGMAMVVVTGGTPTYSFAWPNGDTLDTVMNLPAGAYTVTVTDANGCMNTITSTVTQPASALAANITDNGDGTAIAVGTGGTAPYTFLWDAAAANQTTDTATALIHNGTYGVTITDANGCTDTASVLINFVSVNNIATISNLNMFPNPTSNNVFVELELVENATVEINIMNAVGQLVLSNRLGNVISEKVELNTSNLPSGIYMVQFNIDGQQVSKKLIVSKQ